MNVRLFVVLVGFLFVNVAVSQELKRDVAAKLISEANQVRSSEVTVGPMHSVDRKLDESTTLLNGVCVTFIAPVIDEGRRRRLSQTRTFFYDEEWGWYLYAVEEGRGGDQIDIVSEKKGRIVLR